MRTVVTIVTATAAPVARRGIVDTIQMIDIDAELLDLDAGLGRVPEAYQEVEETGGAEPDERRRTTRAWRPTTDRIGAREPDRIGGVGCPVE
ncbi:MAG: hypothetical protein CM1200mP2_47070 [Planctomycetaceae bacterium]|nr:MAG: hypothetical protein CM1200mP2_47070 [Planctomycetaceae bacterium]